MKVHTIHEYYLHSNTQKDPNEVKIMLEAQQSIVVMPTDAQ